MTSANLENLFPGLKSGAYSITSPEEVRYNCVAWANGDTSLWWDHHPGPGIYWPQRLRRSANVEVYIRIFTDQGYEITTSAGQEEGYEKVAIFSSAEGKFSHVAKMLSSGSWSSKLGALEDIEHSTLEVLQAKYGSVFCHLRRETGGAL